MQKIKTIGLVYYTLGGGGIERGASFLIPQFVAWGYNVVVFTALGVKQQDYSLPPEVCRICLGAEESRSEQEEFALRRERFQAAVDKYGIDLVILHGTQNLGRFNNDVDCLRSLGVKVAVHWHSVFSDKYLRSEGQLSAAGFYDSCRSCDAVITLSKVDAVAFKLLGCKAYWLPYADVDLMDGWRRDSGTFPRRLVWTGRFVAIKQPLDAVKIFELVLDDFPDARLTMLGGGDSEVVESVKAYVDANPRLKAAVDIAGYRKNVADYLRMAGVGLSTSMFEGYGHSLVEFKMAGMPTVAYEMPYLDTAQPNTGVVSVGQGDISGAAKAVVSLFRDPQAMQRLALQARSAYEEIASFDSRAAYDDLFGRIASGSEMPAVDLSEERLKTVISTFVKHVHIGYANMRRCYERRLCRPVVDYARIDSTGMELGVTAADEHLHGRIEFEAGKPQEFSCVNLGPGGVVKWCELLHGKYSPFTSASGHSYSVQAGWILRSRKDKLIVEPYSLMRHLRAEALFSLMLVKRFTVVSLKALFVRWFVFLIRRCMRCPIWLFSDRIGRADDNGRAMFDYVRNLEGTKPNPRCVFAIDARSQDFIEIKKSGGEVVDAAGWRYKFCFLLSEFVISAYHTPAMRMPFHDAFVEYSKDIVNRPRFIYLRHGVGVHGLAHICNRRNDNAEVMVTTVEGEYRSVLEGGTGYTKRQVKLTGLPRYDLLYDDRKKIVTFMPTWRAGLIEWSGDGRHGLAAGAERSHFVAEWSRILTDERLIAACERLGYTLQMMPHPNLAPVVPILSHDAKIHMLPPSTPYRKMFAETDLLVTDYSAAAFDFAYLRKPLLYFQFDKEEYFSGLYRQGFFKYENDGFGEVELAVESLVERIIEYLESGCCLKEKYRSRIDSFFVFDDRQNRKRVYDAIISSTSG